MSAAGNARLRKVMAELKRVKIKPKVETFQDWKILRGDKAREFAGAIAVSAPEED